MSKKRKKRVLAKTIFIACEGSNTEPIYFERLKEEIEDDGLIALTIYPDKEEKSPKTHAVGLVEEAQARIDEFDELWVVFDKDGYTKHKEAFQLAQNPINGKTINIAFSSIAFEHWVLLHFEKNQSAFLKSADVIAHLISQSYYPDYNKTSDIDIYPQLKDRMPTALNNAAWLRYQMKNAIITQNGHVYNDVNPYTDIDELIKQLLGLNSTIVWESLNTAIQTPSFNLLASLNSSSNTISINIENKSLGSTIINSSNCNQLLFLSDINDTISHLTLSETVVSRSNEECSIELTYSCSNISNLLLNIKIHNYHFKIELE